MGERSASSGTMIARRQIFAVDTTGQRTLFAGLSEPESSGPISRTPAGAAGAKEKAEATGRPRVRFKNPDPSRILIGGRTLREHLEAAGLSATFEMRDMLQGFDFTAFETKYVAGAPGGRHPYHPAAMLGLILLGTAEGCSSLRGLERLGRSDLRAMWLTGGLGPDHATIGRFINLHDVAIMASFSTELTAKVLEKTDSDASQVAGDGTVVQAAASRYRQLNRESAEREASEASKAANGNPDDAKLTEKAERAERAATIVEARAKQRKEKGKDPDKAQVSRTEPEAPIQELKQGGYAPSYKPQALANDKRVIVGHSVHPSAEAVQVEPTLEQAKATAERAGRAGPDKLLLDAGYFCLAVIALAVNWSLNLLCPEGRATDKDSWEKRSRGKGKRFLKNAFTYDEERDVYQCPAGEELRCLSRETRGARPAHLYGGAPCAACPLRSRCTKAKKGRVVKRYRGDELKDALRDVMRQPLAREDYKKRQAWVEPVFGVLKDRQGLRRFKRRGLANVRLEFAVHVLAYNLELGARAAAKEAQRATNMAKGVFGVLLPTDVAEWLLSLVLPSTMTAPPAFQPAAQVAAIGTICQRSRRVRRRSSARIGSARVRLARCRV